MAHISAWDTLACIPRFKILNFDNVTQPMYRYHREGEEPMRMAWPILGSNIVVWMITALILFKGMDYVIKFIRFSAITIFSILIILFVRFLCFPGSIEGIIRFLTPTLRSIQQVESWIGAPFLAVFSFGTGWGTVLTMASFNNFKANITRNALIVNFTLMVTVVLSSILVGLADNYLTEHLNFDVMYYHQHPFSFMFLGFPYLFGNMEVSQLWSLMFYLMLTLCELNALIIIVYTTVTSLFDEYEYLRIYKKEIFIGLPVVLFLFSIIFTTNHGYELYNTVIRLCGVAQMEICFLELMIVVWIYGRQRFQRDLQFMLGKTLETWKIYLVRFITPLFILFVMFLSVTAFVFESWSLTTATLLVLFSMKFLPWICIPSYVIVKLISASGSIKARIRRCVRPNDWYPVDPIDRQRYEEALGNTDITHQLVNMTDNIEE